MTGILDPFSRSIDYLRISVTDRCNLRCIYCMPPQGIPQISHSEILTYEEIRTLVQAATGLGINRIRLTGGEPLVRADLPELVGMLARIKGIRELSLTTNGTLLKKCAPELKRAGLTRVNVSLDTLKTGRFHEIARLGRLKDVLEGIAAAKDAGLEPLKVNMVVLRGINDDEVLHFATMTREEAWHVRFIELMPFNTVAESVPSAELQRRIGSLGKLEPCASIDGNGPAAYYRLTGARGTVGFIAPISDTSFCSRCSRMRLTPDGKLRPCLLGEDEIDVRTALRNNASIEELEGLIAKAVAAKPERHRLAGSNVRLAKRNMSQIGG